MRTITALLIVAVILAGCGSTQRTVTYEIKDVATVFLTYANAEGGTQQERVSAPWRRTYQMHRGDFAYCAAQNNTGGSLTVTILVDGKPWRTSTATGQYAIATAQGRLE